MPPLPKARQPNPTKPLLKVSATSSKKQEQQPKETDTQESCPLLQALPLEIREQIWTEVLGNHSIHIRRKPHAGKTSYRLQFCLCQDIPPTPPVSYNWTDDDDDDDHHHHHHHQCTNNGHLPLAALLNLPQTCHQIHNETLPLLYKTNTFVTHETETINGTFYSPLSIITDLSRIFLPENMALIRHLKINKAVPNTRRIIHFRARYYEQDWELVKQKMAGLRTLELGLMNCVCCPCQGCYGEEGMGGEGAICAPPGDV